MGTLEQEAEREIARILAAKDPKERLAAALAWICLATAVTLVVVSVLRTVLQ